MSGCDLANDLLKGGEKKTKPAAEAPKVRGPNETVLAKSPQIDAVAVDATYVYWRDKEGVVRRLPKKGGELKELGKVKANGEILAAPGALYLAELNVLESSHLWRMPIEGGPAVVVPAERDVHAAALSADGKDVFAGCAVDSISDRVCALRGGASSFQMVGDVLPGRVTEPAVDRTHVWFYLRRYEKKNTNPKDTERATFTQLHRMPRGGGAVEAGVRKLGVTCNVLVADDDYLYCATDDALRRGRKAMEPIWETMATMPSRPERIVADSRSLFVSTLSSGVFRISKSALGATVANEKVADVTYKPPFAADEDSLYYGDKDELVRRSTR